MAYVPPSGWVELLQARDTDTVVRVVARFHSRRDCPRVHEVANLRKVDKPYSAVRCTLCASEVADVDIHIDDDALDSELLAGAATGAP